MRERDPMLDELVRIARRGAAHVREHFASRPTADWKVDWKSAGDPVTAADREANALICEALAVCFPGDAVVAEESAPTDPVTLERLLAAPRVFLVDPLDGTSEFIGGRGEFAVMIGVAIDGWAHAGVIALPLTGDVLAGKVDGGSFGEDARGARHPVSVSSCRELARARMLVSRSHRPALVDPLVRRLGVPSPEPCGSVGVKAARIARADAELYVHAGAGIKLWDVCAPEAVVRGAGGCCTDLEGKAIGYRGSGAAVGGGLAVSNGVLHAGVLSAVAWARRGAQS